MDSDLFLLDGPRDFLERLDVEALADDGELLGFHLADDVDKHRLVAFKDGDDQAFHGLLPASLQVNGHVLILLPRGHNLFPTLGIEFAADFLHPLFDLRAVRVVQSNDVDTNEVKAADQFGDLRFLLLGEARGQKANAESALTDLGDAMKTCALQGESACLARVAEARQYITTTLPSRLDTVYGAITAKAPAARVVVLGYPRLYQLGGSCSAGLSEKSRAALNAAADDKDFFSRMILGIVQAVEDFAGIFAGDIELAEISAAPDGDDHVFRHERLTISEMHFEHPAFADDLLEALVVASGGRIRRICVNIERVRERAVATGADMMSLERWGKEPFFTGEPPQWRRA